MAHFVPIADQPTATKILIDPRLPVHVHVESAPQGITCTKAMTDACIARFESGAITVFDDIPLLGKGAGPLAPLRAPRPVESDRRIKKAKTADLMAPLTPAGFDKHLLSRLFPTTGDKKRDASGDRYKAAVVYQFQFSAAVDAVRKLVRQLFPGYKFTGVENNTHRLLETFAEGLHVDSFAGSNDEFVRLRVFYNVDYIPRLWRSTYSSPELAWRSWPLLAPIANRHPNELNDHLNQNIVWHEQPAHTIYFAPGALAICDTQLVSHEILYGRNALAMTFLVDPNSLTRPENSFQGQVRAAVAKCREKNRG